MHRSENENFIAAAVWHWPSNSKWMTELLSLGHFFCFPACLRKSSIFLMCRIRSLWGILGDWGQNVWVPADKCKPLPQKFPWQEVKLISVKWNCEACLVSLKWKTLGSENDAEENFLVELGFSLCIPCSKMIVWCFPKHGLCSLREECCFLPKNKDLEQKREKDSAVGLNLVEGVLFPKQHCQLLLMGSHKWDFVCSCN